MLWIKDFQKEESQLLILKYPHSLSWEIGWHSFFSNWEVSLFLIVRHKWKIQIKAEDNYSWFQKYGVFWPYVTIFTPATKQTHTSACVNLVHCMDECILTPQSQTLSHILFHESASPFIYSSHHTKTHTPLHSLSELYSKSIFTAAASQQWMIWPRP